MPHQRTVRGSVLRLLEKAPRRYSDLTRELGKPDKTIYIALKQLSAAGHVAKNGNGTYLITEEGRAALVELELEETARDLVKKLGPERGATVRRCLEALVADTQEDLPGRLERRRELVLLLVDAFN